MTAGVRRDIFRRMPDSPGGYDDVAEIGVLYDSIPAYDVRGDVAFYVDEATHADGPVLELGCGTGRVLLPAARAGATMVGVEGSRRMLDRCREKLSEEPADVQARVSLHHADVRALDLDARFALVLAPFRILQHVVAIDDQLAVLEGAARHLAPGGRLVLDVFNPLFRLMVTDRSAEREDTTATLADGRTLRRTFRVPRIRWADQVSETELIYYVGAGTDSPDARYVQAFDMRWYGRAELVHLLARAGFTVDAVYGNFDRSPLTDESPEMVVCAVRR